MAVALQAQNTFLLSSSSLCTPCQRRVRPPGRHTTVGAAVPSVSIVKAAVPTRRIPVEECLKLRETRTVSGGHRGDLIGREEASISGRVGSEDQILTAKLYAVMEAAADRAGMHDAIGAQRDNWNSLLLGSVNSITLAASVAAGLSAMPIGTASNHQVAFKASSVLLYSAATAMLLVVNKIQPSQLAEEQRNAARLFRQLEKKIQTILALGCATPADVEDAIESVLALDKAYPLPLLGGMLDKFPETVKPTVWWPKLRNRKQRRQADKDANNGWSEGLERVMAGVLRTLKKNDTEEYVREAKLALGVNSVLSAAGPLLTGLATFAATMLDTGAGNPAAWPLLLSVVSGSLAAVVSTLEHGGQVGMVFEMYRNCAGYYRRLEEEIEVNLGEQDPERREDGELLELKVALQLGRSLPELRGLASHSCCRDVDIGEFAGKLF